MPPAKKQKKTEIDLVLPHFARYFFAAVIASVGGLFFWVISPFFDTLIFASLVAVIFYPMQAWLMKKMGGRRTIPALITSLFLMFIFLLPLVLLSIFVVQEAANTFVVLEDKLHFVDFRGLSGFSDLPWLGEIIAKFSERFGLNEFLAAYDLNFITILRDLVENITSFIVNSAGSFFKGLSGVIVQLFIFLITVFYFFKDGDKVINYLKKLSPLPVEYETEIEAKLKESTYGVVVGNFGTALIQGFAGGLGFAIAGVDNIFLWGTLMAFASLIPYVGATIIWLPIAISLMFVGEYVGAGFLIIWGLMIVATVDNVVRPFLIGGQTKMHSLATFLVILGGILVFGLKGVIYGPIILTLTITLIHIYEKEYKDVLTS